jgi:hypothetical protein
MFVARYARKKEERWFVFRALPEKRTTFPLFCERSEHHLSSYKKIKLINRCFGDLIENQERQKIFNAALLNFGGS